MITTSISNALRWLYEKSVELEGWAINRKMKQVRGKLTPVNISVLREALSYEGKKMLDDELADSYYQGLHDATDKSRVEPKHVLD
jgi:hypothetical protein